MQNKVAFQDPTLGFPSPKSKYALLTVVINDYLKLLVKWRWKSPGRLWYMFRQCVHAKSLQSCLTLCHPWTGSSVYGILQARTLEWVAMPSSRGSSRTRDWTHTFWLASGFFTAEPPGKPMKYVFIISDFEIKSKNTIQAFPIHVNWISLSWLGCCC